MSFGAPNLMYYPLEDPTIQQSEIAQERINWERKLESAKTFANLGVGGIWRFTRLRGLSIDRSRLRIDYILGHAMYNLLINRT